MAGMVGMGMFEKYGKRKIYIIAYCAVSVLLIILTLVFFIAYGRISYKGNDLRLKSINTGSITMLDRNGQELAMEWGNFSTSMISPVSISYLGEIITYEFYFEYPGYDMPVEVFTFPNGEQIISEVLYVSIDDNTPAYKQTDEWVLFETLKNRYGYNNIRTGLVGICVFGLALLALGMGEIIYPESFWRLQHYFTVSEGKPTDFALSMNRLTGFVFSILPYIVISVFYSTGINA